MKIRTILIVTAVPLLMTAAASFAGYLVSERNDIEPFTRFHLMISPDNGFRPTARQVRALAFAKLDRSKVNVIVGGSSVMYGIGQPVDLIWTKELAASLGDEYRVINLAMRGGDVAGISSFTAEMILREGFRVIYVTDMAVAMTTQVIGSAPYQYFYWDARARGYLYDHPARDVALGSVPRTPIVDGLKSAINNLNDLRSHFDYWSRRSYVDLEINPPQEQRYTFQAENLALYVHLSGLQVPAHWPFVQSYLEAAIPEPLRRSTIISLCLNSPGISDFAPAETRANWAVMQDLTADRIASAGAHPVEACNDFSREDYLDRVHLSVDGGQKLAHRIAETVRTLAAP